MSMPQVLLVAAIVWVLLVLLVRLGVWPWLLRAPGGDALTGFLWRIARFYCRFWHRATYHNTAILPADDADHDGLLVVANHTGALDPVLIQSACGFIVRWMMAADMIGPNLAWLESHGFVIPVERDGRDSGPLRQTIRLIKAGGAIGLFPEGRITMPAGELRPFMPGVGFIAAKAKVPILLVWISGTPETNKLGEAFKQRSRARVEFIDLIEPGEERDPAAIAERLRRRIAEVSGWPLNDEVLPPGGAEASEAA
ncbi:MAG: 1-acyl-sn-glycerol-3-phosphate acyltransferase [Phycisphaerae bacterium]|nr:1-acyl-sn-glycerol-3-phosphate acyltransferase [Phycisphaerae bacterium]